jgi:hypothetical protein
MCLTGVGPDQMQACVVNTVRRRDDYSRHPYGVPLQEHLLCVCSHREQVGLAVLGERSAECNLQLTHGTPHHLRPPEPKRQFPPKASTVRPAPLPAPSLPAATRPNLRSPMPKSRSLRPFTLTTNAQGKRNASPGGAGPPSPTFTETTNVSAVNLGENGPAKIITRSDLKASMQSYENVSLVRYTKWKN